MAPDKKVCPFMSRIAVKVSCIKEECQWWFREDEPQAKGDCVIQAMGRYLYLSATKPK
jgi:hypothetical protein